jgi:hypothetical protein
MCDYSLHNVASRPAKAGDRLRTTEFALSGTRGFSAVGRPDVAVCLRPGTELAFDENVVTYRSFGFFPHRKLRGKVAQFRQINMDQPHTHHDALEFPDGQIVLITDLRPGQSATVLTLPHGAETADEHHAREREERRADTRAFVAPLT